MADHIQGNGKAVEQALRDGQVFIAVAIDHLLAVPKGVVIAFAIMDGGNELEAVAVYGVSAIDVIVQIEGFHLSR